MSSFSRLPFVVLDLILCEAVNTSEKDIDNWVNSLPVLGVCRKWRKIAESLVYHNAIMNGYDQHKTGFIDHSDNKTTGSKLINTNIDLIKATGNTHLVKTLYIKMANYQY
ncbi:hypothetical protein GGF37_004734, partial [Kickxella alabastrina]